ncbi:MAG TPA: hypothetical protein VI298_00760 [Geobacteraceae bacterium]
MRKLAVALAAGLVTVLGGMAFGADKVTVTGEVIDTYCYATAGAKGEGHRSCGLTCAKKGIPVALLEQGTEKVYVLLPGKQATPLPKGVVDKMGRQATVTGSVYAVGGSQFLTVETVK